MTVLRQVGEVSADTRDRHALDTFATLARHQLPELAPPFRITDVDERTHPLLSEGEQRLCRARFGRGEQCDGGYAWKLPHHARDLCRVLGLVPRDRDEYRGDPLCAQIDEQFVETFAMQCFVASLSRGIDTLAFSRRQKGGYRTIGAERSGVGCVRDRVVWNDIGIHGASRVKWTCSPAREVRIDAGESRL